MRALLLASLLLAAAPARAWRLWGEPSDKKIRPVQELSDKHLSREVIAALTPEFMQTLRGTDLRQAYVLKGDNLDVLGRVDEALGVYQLGVKLFPTNVDLLTRQGDMLHRTGEGFGTGQTTAPTRLQAAEESLILASIPRLAPGWTEEAK